MAKRMDMCINLKNYLENIRNDDELMKKRDASFKKASRLNEIKNIKKYYLYKYMPEALDLGKTDELTKTALVCTSVICEFCAMEIATSGALEFKKILRTAQLFSKEIEHSDENLNLLVYQTPQFQ